MKVKIFLVSSALWAVLLMSFSVVQAQGRSTESVSQVSEFSYTSSKVCGKCHTDIYNHWKNSMHRHSVDDPIFNLAYMQALMEIGDEAKKMCLRCHAPVSGVNGDFDLVQSITKEGVSCDFCHTISAVDLENETQPYKVSPGGVKRGPIRDAQPTVHKSQFSELYTRSEFCAGCHEYSRDGVGIIETYSEWKSSSYSKERVQCQDCHMPVGEGYVVSREVREGEDEINVHNLQGGHSLEQLKEAAKVEIMDIRRAEGRIYVSVNVTNFGSGHMIPTGTPSRELILEVDVKNSRGGIIGKKRMIFKKVLLDRVGNELTRDCDILLRASIISMDNRIRPGETRQVGFSFLCSEDEEYVVEAKLFYHYRPEVIKAEEMLVEMAVDRRASRFQD